ncbi:MAG: hypothetical protein WBV94_13850 [Blastocatellia bacterium]
MVGNLNDWHSPGDTAGDAAYLIMIGLISAILLITIGLRWKYSQHKDAIALTKRWQHEDLPRHEEEQAKRML